MESGYGTTSHDMVRIKRRVYHSNVKRHCRERLGSGCIYVSCAKAMVFGLAFTLATFVLVVVLDCLPISIHWTSSSLLFSKVSKFRFTRG